MKKTLPLIIIFMAACDDNHNPPKDQKNARRGPPIVIEGGFKCEGKIDRDSYKLHISYLGDTTAIFHFDVNEIAASQGIHNKTITSWALNSAPILSGSVKEVESNTALLWRQFSFTYEIGTEYPTLKKYTRFFDVSGSQTGKKTVYYTVPSTDCHKYLKINK